MKWVKKMLKNLALLLVIAVLGLYLYGYRPSAGQNSATVDISRPAAQIWRYLTNDDLVKSWVSGLEEIRHENPGQMGVGAQFYMEERYEGALARMQWTTTGFEPPRQLKFTIEGAGDPSASFTEKGEYVLVEENGRTHLTLSGFTEYHGILARLFEPFITPKAQKKLESDLNTLKSLVEAEPLMPPQ